MAIEYIFRVQSGTDPRTGRARWRWALARLNGSPDWNGSEKIRSTSTFETEEACREDAEWHRAAICEARIVTVPT